MTYDMNLLTTEAQNERTENIDKMTPLKIVSLMNEEDKKVAFAVESELSNIAEAVEKIVDAFRRGGRLIYIGAGTSGRLGILDASECPPTFGTSREQVLALIAGGSEAFTASVEGAEDDESSGTVDMKKAGIAQNDIVVGITASGSTPYVIGALLYAKEMNVTTIGISCNKDSRICEVADISITPVVGAEVLTGSTRLKSGTAQKMVLNMLTTASFVCMGKTYKNLMVDMQPTNLKLMNRAKSIIMTAVSISDEDAETLLRETQYDVKLSIFMYISGLQKEQAKEVLNSHGGFIRKALDSLKEKKAL